jgi:lysyl-tRNA synthetase class 2
MANERLEEIRARRLHTRQVLIERQLPPYPAEVRRSHTLATLTRDFPSLSSDSVPVVVVGRVVSIRRHGSLIFCDIRDESGSFQLQVSRDVLASDIFERFSWLDSGDWVQAAGDLVLTKRNVSALRVTAFHIISKAIRPLPSTWYGLKDHEERFRQREVDLLLNQGARDIIVLRSRIVRWLRDYFLKHEYLEVETPILQATAGGAAAQPFLTRHGALGIPLFLRVAAELYLKRLLVGGFEKVFELGRYFRNEGIDRQHNPEFTMLEANWAFADYEDYMDFTEQLLADLTQTIRGSTVVSWGEHSLSFATPLPRKRFVDLVSEAVGFDVLAQKDPAAYVAFCAQAKLPPPEPATYVNALEHVYKHRVRPEIIQPSLLYDYPQEMAPLAKRNLTDPRIAEQFQLIVGGMELVKSYTELNDPVVQRAVLEEQLKEHEAGNVDVHTIDYDYLRAMEYGMPPNAGWGMGIDRLVLVLSGAHSLRDTLAFPLLRPEAAPHA